MLSLIIPLHNDGKRLLTNWNKLYSFLSKYINDFEIILAEDGSIDNTYEICKKLHRKYHNVKISHYKNKLGKGLAIKKACKICKGKYIGYIDSDMATDISFILDANKLLKTNDVVIGSRYIEKSHTKRKKYRLFMSFVYNYIVKIVLHNNVYDNQCGFKFFKRDTILKLNKKKYYESLVLGYRNYIFI